MLTTFSARTRSEKEKDTKPHKATRINDNTLHPTIGDLKCRLDTSIYIQTAGMVKPNVLFIFMSTENMKLKRML